MLGFILDMRYRSQLGPFVDINNSLIKDGAVTQTPAAYFQQYFTSKLDVLFTSVPGISIFLVPSPRDIIHDHIAFPQNTLNTEQLGISRVRQLLFPYHLISALTLGELRIYTFSRIPVFSRLME